MNLFKAHFVHPYTQVPLIVYFNESDGHVTFEKDQEVLDILIKMEKKIGKDRKFVRDLHRTSHLCKTQYPVASFQDVFDFLEGIGVDKEDLTFQQLYVH
ncbi:hypothetical protein M3212_15725 [Alkalihalobacillus oceani]|uniref:hypothetical protein n=1 Tax=Halalkalibacter oceani TaxID=1653776 RepID=UPI002040500B|nr:hypothetical protein [Halalkalibacter oceani]MCM3762222.1 hypothetical protein [Halalkalibacter oceani]